MIPSVEATGFQSATYSFSFLNIEHHQAWWFALCQFFTVLFLGLAVTFFSWIHARYLASQFKKPLLSLEIAIFFFAAICCSVSAFSEDGFRIAGTAAALLWLVRCLYGLIAPSRLDADPFKKPATKYGITIGWWDASGKQVADPFKAAVIKYGIVFTIGLIIGAFTPFLPGRSSDVILDIIFLPTALLVSSVALFTAVFTRAG